MSSRAERRIEERKITTEKKKKILKIKLRQYIYKKNLPMKIMPYE